MSNLIELFRYDIFASNLIELFRYDIFAVLIPFKTLRDILSVLYLNYFCCMLFLL